MATKEALATQAEVLAGKLGREVQTEGLTNAELVSLVGSLKGEVKIEKEEKRAIDAARDEENARAEKAGKKKKLPPFSVAEGHSITARGRGVIQPGGEVTARDFGGGEATLRDHVEAGVLVEG